ncbi:MAG TPA: hypothetical protein VFW44_13930 [Bryobacteraceae bacterium]|nr:hypothetical protein [Bryobacteraceae bacterium]
MEASVLFAGVLDPGERLIWSGQPRKQVFAMAGFNFALLATGLGYIFGKMQGLQKAPLPPVLEFELVLVGLMLLAAGYLLGTRIFRAWTTAYAVTDRRLLATIGRDRRQIRTLWLTDVDNIRTEYRPKMGKVLSFRQRGHVRPVFWPINDVERVRKLIETARAAATSQAAA